jgi:hypothetical protein
VADYSYTPRFRRDFKKLTREQRGRFEPALRRFLVELNADEGFSPGLRVKGVQAAPGVFEMSWAPNGRMTWSYGQPGADGATHVILRRVGTHAVFDNPRGSPVATPDLRR